MRKFILFLSLFLSLLILVSPAFSQGSDLRVRNLYVYRGIDGRGGVPLWWDGFIYGQYAGTARDCVFYNYTGSGQYLMRLQGDGANVFTIDKSGNVVAAGTISGAIAIPDTDASNYLSLVWNEDDVADRTLNFLVSGGDRSLTLQNNLTVEALSLVNQDLTTDSILTTFAGLSLSDGNITNVGDISLDSISSDSGTTINVDLGSNAGDDFTVDINKLVVEGDTGNVGINATAPLGRVDIVGVAPASTISAGIKNLLIQQEVTTTSGYLYNLLSEFDVDAPSNSSGLYFGGHFELGTVTGNSVNYTGDFTALQGQAEHFGTGTMDKAIGVFGAVVNRSSGTITEARAGVFRILDYSTGTITNAHTIYVDNYDGSATVVGKTGIMISDITGATNNTELLIGTPTIPTGDFAIYNASTADSYFVGSVGIGIATPGAPAHVHTADAENAVFITTNGTTRDLYTLYQEDRDGSPTTWVTGYDQSADAFKIAESTALDSSTRLTIDTDGNVGINTTGPDRKLDVLDSTNPQLRLAHTDGTVWNDLQTTSTGELQLTSSAGRAILDLKANTSSNPKIQFSEDSVNEASIIWDSASADLYITNRINSSGADLLFVTQQSQERMRIRGNGQVGINTTSSDTLFEMADEAVDTVLTVSTYHDTEATTPTITMRKADNTEVSPAAVDQDAVLGTVNFNGYDDDSWDNGARIYAKADANWGAAERGTELYFSTRDGNGTLTDQFKITAEGDFEGVTSKWWSCNYISMLEVAAGGSGATWTAPDADIVGGYQLNADTEYLYFTVRVCPNWDGASDLRVGLRFEVNVDNTGGADADTVDFQLICYYKGATDIASKTQTLEEPTTVGKSAQYKAFDVVFTIDHDIGGGNDVDISDVISFRLNLETDTSEVDDVIANFAAFAFKTAEGFIQISEVP